MCGEKQRYIVFVNITIGSPPRVRGKVLMNSSNVIAIRITPACAGKRMVKSNGKYNNRDHPRVCGEKGWYVLKSDYDAGSPPRVRGKVYIFCIIVCNFRITPACAGKSIKCRAKFRFIWDHPRVCGEKCCTGVISAPITGSPPRVRGKASFS